MPRFTRILDLGASLLPDYTTVCARMRELKEPL